MDLQDIVSKYPPRKILMLPITIAVIAFIILGANYLSTGSPIKLGVEFTGGAVVTVPAVESQDTLTKQLAAYPINDVRSIGSRYMVQFGSMSESDYTNLAKLVNSQYKDADIRYMGPIYSQDLLSQALRYIPISFILMAIVVFVIFRTPLVSGIVVLCAILDISIAAASMNITGVKLSLGTVAALLMLIGYSVDTNILLTKTALTPRQTLTVDETIVSAMTTGLMMTGTTIAAVLALFVASNLLYLVVPSFTRMDIIADISTVLLFGLLADIFNTWITNAQAIRWYMSRSKKAVVGRHKE
jgi:preprotein translocase subunit SecF